MRAVLQRVSSASVSVSGEVVGAIGVGLVALVGVARGDTAERARRLAAKTASLRVLRTSDADFGATLAEGAGEILVVSQFTLLADVRRGSRPSWSRAAPGPEAAPLVAEYADALAGMAIQVARGSFGAMMEVTLVGDGPVTLVLDSEDLESPRRGSSA